MYLTHPTHQFMSKDPSLVQLSLWQPALHVLWLWRVTARSHPSWVCGSGLLISIPCSLVDTAMRPCSAPVPALEARAGIDPSLLLLLGTVLRLSWYGYLEDSPLGWSNRSHLRVASSMTHLHLGCPAFAASLPYSSFFFSSWNCMS